MFYWPRDILVAIFALVVLWECALPQAVTSVDHPGTRAFHTANDYYEGERYEWALRYYQQAAAWGHKISQFNLGTLYYNGLGVDRDPSEAWAWFELAAERGYPHMVEVADSAWRELTEAERDRAAARLEELRVNHSDEATLPRLERHLERVNRSSTGSRLPGSGSSPVMVFSHRGLNLPADSFYDDGRGAGPVAEMIAREKAWFESLARTRVRIRHIEDLGDEG